MKDNINEGTTLQPEKGRGLEVWVDADFSGNCNRSESEDRETSRSIHGYIIMYEGCPILQSLDYKPKLYYQALKVSILVSLMH